MITAVAADKLERAGVAAFRPALHPAGRLAAQAGGQPVAELTHGKDGLASRRCVNGGIRFLVTHWAPPGAAVLTSAEVQGRRVTTSA
jgi:hypothetical protein